MVENPTRITGAGTVEVPAPITTERIEKTVPGCHSRMSTHKEGAVTVAGIKEKPEQKLQKKNERWYTIRLFEKGAM
jgi:hypothetical protein